MLLGLINQKHPLKSREAQKSQTMFFFFYHFYSNGKKCSSSFPLFFMLTTVMRAQGILSLSRKGFFLFQAVYIIHNKYAVSIFAVSPLQRAAAIPLFN